jgi:hypothetical protein
VKSPSQGFEIAAARELFSFDRVQFFRAIYPSHVVFSFSFIHDVAKSNSNQELGDSIMRLPVNDVL